MGTGFQMGCRSSQGWGARQGMGFQMGHGIPDRNGGVSDREWWGSRQGLMQCQAGMGNNINESPKWNSLLLDFE